MADKEIDFNALGQAMDTTFGRSSTPKTASYSVKFSMMGAGRVLASYQAIVNFATERQMIEMKRAYSTEAEDVVKAYVKQIKATYKDIAEETLSMKEVSSTDSVEIIGFNVHNAKRTAYFRRKSVFEIG